MSERNEYEDLKALLGSYFLYALESKKKHIDARLWTEHQIHRLYTETVDEVAKKIRSSGFAAIQNIGAFLREEFSKLAEKLISLFDDSIKLSVEAGAHQSREITLHTLRKAKIDEQPIIRTFFRTNEAAVEDVKTRSVKGLNLSDRIWNTSAAARDHIGRLIAEAVRDGKTPIEVAKSLERYVRDGAKTLVSDYPDMMARFDYSLPQNLSYEAFRLARTEMAKAYGEGKKRASASSPGFKGMKWSLSPSHPVFDVCDHLAAHNEGLGVGVYSPGNEPDFPAHPNCLCDLVAVFEETDDLVDRLIQWNKDPMSQPDIEDWYQTQYKTGAA